MNNKLEFNPDYLKLTDFIPLTKPSYPFNSAHVILNDNRDRVVLVREKNKEWVNLVGGRFKKGENAIETVNRECLEEIGLNPVNLTFLGNLVLEKSIFPLFKGRIETSDFVSGEDIAEIMLLKWKDFLNLLNDANPKITAKVIENLQKTQ